MAKNTIKHKDKDSNVVLDEIMYDTRNYPPFQNADGAID